jgi:uncharacterized protein
MSEETAARLAEVIAHSLNPARPAVKVSFGTGETFLHFERFLATADLIVDRCRGRGGSTQVCVITNGVLLDEVRLQELAKRRVSLIFSIDGPPEVHDALRRDASGRGSFQAAFNNFLRYAELGYGRVPPVSCTIQSVFGPHSGSVQQLVSFWVKNEIPLFNLIPLSPTPFKPTLGAGAVSAARVRCLEGLREWAWEQAGYLSASDFLSRYQGPSVIYRGWRRLLLEQEDALCAPAQSILACGHDGSLYPCEGFLGGPRWRLGDLWQGVDAKRLQEFRAECRKAEAVCASCPGKRACEKPCLAVQPAASPKENVAAGCADAQTLANILQESFAVLMRNETQNCRNV